MNTKTTLTEQIVQWDKILDEYESQLKIPEYKAPGEDDELQKYLIMGIDDLLKLDKEYRAAIAYRLQQYAFHIKRTINRNSTRINKLKRILSVYAANKLTQYNRWNYEEKMYALVNDDEYAQRIHTVIGQFQERTDRLEYLDRNLETLANLMRNFSYSYQKENNYATNT